MPTSTRRGRPCGPAAALLAILLVAAVAPPPAAAQPTPSDGQPAAGPAALAAQDPSGALFECMRHADERHGQGRRDHLRPVVAKLFDVPTLARIAVGPDLAELTPDHRSALRDAVGRPSVATVASTFDDVEGESCAVDADVSARGADRFVTSRFDRGGAPVDITPGSLGGTVFQLATGRSDPGATFRDAGHDGPMAPVTAQADEEMEAF